MLHVADELGGPDATADGAAKRLREVAALARDALEWRRATPAAALSEAIFDRAGFAREVDDKDLRFVLLPSVLAARRGTCVPCPGLPAEKFAGRNSRRAGLPSESAM